MRQLLLAIAIAVSILPSCHKKESGASVTKVSTGVITGRDGRKCMCCGGWLVNIDNVTYQFYDLPAGSTVDLNTLVLPATVQLTWKISKEPCGFPNIDVIKIER